MEIWEMRRRGEVRMIWVLGILAVLILVLVLSGLWKRFDFFIFIANLLGFDVGTPPEGTSIVGINLADGNLRYFTGNKWKEIKTEGNKPFVLGNYEFIPEKFYIAFYNFYVKSERRPNNLKLNVNHWRY